MNQDIKKLWVAALRSGEYKQGKCSLISNNKKQFCCLGVLCDLHSKEFPENKWTPYDNDSFIKRLRYMDSMYALPIEVIEWTESRLDLNTVSLTIDGTYSPLTVHNDSNFKSFDKIADAIEAQL